ncbi:MAG: hypothetical protein J6Y55_11075 [Bacteroidales bacterium]|nr:hypothetical protein [Bacteroidales bacterium]
MAKKDGLQAKANELRQQLGCGKLWYVPKANEWFTRKAAADFVASTYGSKVIEY